MKNQNTATSHSPRNITFSFRVSTEEAFALQGIGIDNIPDNGYWHALNTEETAKIMHQLGIEINKRSPYVKSASGSGMERNSLQELLIAAVCGNVSDRLYTASTNAFRAYREEFGDAAILSAMISKA